MERRLAAIVAADVVNYSVLLGKNDIGTIDTLNRLHHEVIHPSVTQYDGRIARYMGDGSLIAFDSALNAVSFAFDVQRSMAKRKSTANDQMRIDFRMGVNVGDIIRENHDIHGEGINVAVRLEELAPPGGICLSDGVYRQTKNALSEDLLPIGERHLKNIADPVFVWRWQPPGSGDEAPGGGAALSHAKARLGHGRQILDPKVTALLVELYMRSARLALSDAFDELLAAEQRDPAISLNDIHRKLAEKLSEAGEPLFPIGIQRSEESGGAHRRTRLAPKPMSDFIADALDDGDILGATEMLRRAQAILSGAGTEVSETGGLDAAQRRAAAPGARAGHRTSHQIRLCRGVRRDSASARGDHCLEVWPARR
ncbi:MAG: adenylate/guanylate cyclase domain-containing protein [Rhodomicrobium sp.]|nr:adenylate/guanylate cyclase domain-containing protein [Rhodomicrobium sp.]